VNTIAQSKILIDYIIIALAPLVDAEARREIGEYFATLHFKAWARHTCIERPRRTIKRPRGTMELARIPRSPPSRGKVWRKKSLWRPEGHAVERDIAKLRDVEAQR
jgi:hypothetical protein